jgi:hypothetical protein
MRNALVMQRLWLVLLLAGGCSYTFDSGAPDLPLLGAPPDTSRLPKLNVRPAGAASVIYGVDGKPWAAFTEPLDTDTGVENGMRFVRLVDPPAQETLVAGNPVANGSTFYYIPKPAGLGPGSAPPANLELHVHRVGAGQPDQVIELPFTKSPLFIADTRNTVFLWWVEDPSTTQFLVQRLDGSFSRMLPVPAGLDPAAPESSGDFFYSSDGAWLYVQDGNGVFTRHSTTSSQDVTIGPLPPLHLLDEPRKQLLGCSTATGLIRVPIDGSPPTVIDPGPCDDTGLLWVYNKTVVYQSSGAIVRVPIDGSAPPWLVLPPGPRFLGFGPGDQPVSSQDPPDRYVGGAGSGFIGPWQFMQRGRNIQFSHDGTMVRWLEWAAQESGVGELTSAPIGGASAFLARNVRRYDEIAPGQILVSANRAFRGTQNRVIVVDEKQRISWWVADAAGDYTRIPKSTDILVDIVSGPSGYDIVRVPVPQAP